MTPEEIKERVRELCGAFASLREALEGLLPHLSADTHLAVFRGMLADVSRAAANCASCAHEGPGRPPIAVPLGPPASGVFYSLTTVGADQEQGASGYPHGEVQERMRRRTVGIFAAPEEAEAALANNYGDLAEAGWYRWAVIEEVRAGLYPGGREHQWWEYDKKADRWEKREGRPAPIREYLERNRIGGHWCEVG